MGNLDIRDFLFLANENGLQIPLSGIALWTELLIKGLLDKYKFGGRKLNKQWKYLYTEFHMDF